LTITLVPSNSSTETIASGAKILLRRLRDRYNELGQFWIDSLSTESSPVSYSKNGQNFGGRGAASVVFIRHPQAFR
jgi:hypothetical protein